MAGINNINYQFTRFFDFIYLISKVKIFCNKFLISCIYPSLFVARLRIDCSKIS